MIETLADLTPDPRNARRHNPRNVGMLEKALGEVGAARSIVIDEHGVVLAGNATIEAAGRAGIERVQVVDADGETIIAVRRTGLTKAQKTRLALYDNRTAELADWDADVIADLMATERELLDGLFADDELAELVEDLIEPDTADAEPQIDRAAELNKKWQVKTGDLWRIGEHRLLCGDSTKRKDVQRVMGGEKADIGVSDPPYGVLDEKWDRAFTQSDLEMMLEHTSGMVACFNAAKPAVLFSMLSLSPMPERVGVWRHSHIAPKPGMIWSWQPVFYWRCGDAVAWDSLDWFQGNADRDGTHPTQKPVEFFSKIIGSVKANSAFDPFLGSGTTMVACENLGRKCYGMEISPAYCAVILERMQAAFPDITIKRAS